MYLANIGEKSISIDEMNALSQFYATLMFPPGTPNLESKISHAYTELQKLSTSTSSEKIYGKFTYGDLKKTLGKIMGSHKVMKEMVLLPLNYGYQPMGGYNPHFSHMGGHGPHAFGLGPPALYGQPI